MAVLHLQFRGVLQSWGVRDEWMAKRRTASSPTESAVLGLIECALGIDRNDEERRTALRSKIRIIPHSGGVKRKLVDEQTISIADYEREGIELNGFPSARGGIKRDKTGRPVWNETFTKQYVEDCVSDPLKADVEGDDDTIARIQNALLHPVYPYYLGRYCCTPCGSVIMPNAEAE